MNFFKYQVYFCLFVAAIGMNSCVVQDPYTGVAPGMWRGVLYLEGKEISKIKTSTKDDFSEQYVAGQLPFNFEVVYDSKDKFHIDIINGSERIKVDNIEFGRNRFKERRDTLRMNFPIYNTHISAIFEDKVMEGWYVPASGSNYKIKFVAKHGQSFRFTELKNLPSVDVTGKWAAVFGLDKPAKEHEPAVGEFQQKGTDLTGTFMTETGDYRFLQGTVQQKKVGGKTVDKLFLSCFDGSHAFLFEALAGKDRLDGAFWSGGQYKTTWVAERNANARLRAADSLTSLKAGASFNFSGLDGDGKRRSLNDAAWNGKIKVVQVLGTWCPNCLDETKFMMEYLGKNPNNNVAVIGLGYEKSHQPSARIAKLMAYKKQLQLPYTVLDAGFASADSAAASLPMLNTIMSFPTTVILDKNNKVRKIYTGFSGPATSEYTKYKAEFAALIQKIAAE